MVRAGRGARGGGVVDFEREIEGRELNDLWTEKGSRGREME